MSFKPEVQVNGCDEWVGNALRFATREEAEANARDLMGRWLLVTDTRVTESDDPVNYAWVAPGALVAHDAQPHKALGDLLDSSRIMVDAVSGDVTIAAPPAAPQPLTFERVIEITPRKATP